MSQDFTTPVGRMIGGSIYKTAEKKPQPGDDPAKPKKPMYDFGIAIPKNGQHWRQTDWGAKIYAAGVEEFGAAICDHPSFAWKIIDGDATAAATAGGTAPNTKEGYPGNWILWFSGATAPTLYNANGTQVIAAPDYLKPGHYIQVLGNAKGNGNKPGNPGQKKSGVYLNHTYVAHAGFGPEISYKPDVASAGFGQSPLPAGVSAVPVGGLPGTVPVASPINFAALTPPSAYTMTEKAGAYTHAQMVASGWKDADLIAQGYMLPVGGNPPAPPAVAQPPAPPTATAVMPNPAMIPAGPPVAPIAPTFKMTPLAQGYTREQMHASNWTDQALIENGYMVHS